MWGVQAGVVSALQAMHPKSPKLIGGRNWCEVTEVPLQPSPGAGVENPRLPGALVFSLRVEDPKDMAAAPEVYAVPVPTYVPPKNTSGQPSTFSVCAPALPTLKG